MTKKTDLIPADQARTLPEAFLQRVARSPDALAYIQYCGKTGEWRRYSWGETATEVDRWQAALLREGMQPGDRVAVMMGNCREWVIFDLAALGLGLVTVPIYANDRAENVAYILENADVRLLLVGAGEQLASLSSIASRLSTLERVVLLEDSPEDNGYTEGNLTSAAAWLPQPGARIDCPELEPGALATIVYTSGTTGSPKGVMLSHRNILWNAYACLAAVEFHTDDLMLSFLPLSHMMERTGGCYMPILAGSAVAFSRSIPQLAEDLCMIAPTILVSVPRIFERFYARIKEQLEREGKLAQVLFDLAVSVGWQRFEYAQGRGRWTPAQLLWPLLDRLVAAKVRGRLGGRLRFAVSGGAPLNPEISRLFISLGISILQGFGLTETSPVISANTLEDNLPESVGRPLSGIEVRIGESDELLTRSPSVMLGYWKNPSATAEVIDADGWFHTGDQAHLDDGHIFITGRLKDIIVLANGEKIPPGDMELAIELDEMIDQVMVIGEGKPYLSAILVLSRSCRENPGQGSSVESLLLDRIKQRLTAFPGYANIRRIAVVDEPWTVENGMMTPTLKLRRNRVMARHADEIEALYSGH